MKKQQDKNVEKKQKSHSSQMLLFGDVLILNINKWGSGGGEGLGGGIGVQVNSGGFEKIEKLTSRDDIYLAQESKLYISLVLVPKNC